MHPGCPYDHSFHLVPVQNALIPHPSSLVIIWADRRRLKYIIKMDLNKYDLRMWTWIIWLKRGSSGRPLWTLMNFELLEGWGIIEYLSDSQLLKGTLLHGINEVDTYMLNDPITNSTIQNKASLLPCCNLERQDFIFALWDINIRESDNYSRNVPYQLEYKAKFFYTAT
jgi:hypothetical protein